MEELDKEQEYKLAAKPQPPPRQREWQRAGKQLSQEWPSSGSNQQPEQTGWQTPGSQQQQAGWPQAEKQVNDRQQADRQVDKQVAWQLDINIEPPQQQPHQNWQQDQQQQQIQPQEVTLYQSQPNWQQEEFKDHLFEEGSIVGITSYC